MSEKPDIFDRIMAWPGLRALNPLYRKYKEVLLYLFFGGLTMIVSVASYWFFSEPMKLHVQIANVLSWVLAVLFAYITNRIWVFDQKTHGGKELLAQMFRFFSGRVATLLVENAILFIFVQKLHGSNMVVKIVAQVVVVVSNYFISKFMVFRNKDSKQ